LQKSSHPHLQLMEAIPKSDPKKKKLL